MAKSFTSIASVSVWLSVSLNHDIFGVEEIKGTENRQVSGGESRRLTCKKKCQNLQTVIYSIVVA